MKKMLLFGILGSVVLSVAVFRVAAASDQPQPSSNQATVVIDANAAAKAYDPMIFGGFLEHFGRQVYGGVFEPGSPLSDKNGFRKDVIAALKELKVPVVRWPGGCFVSGYHWEKGVGKNRKPVDDMAWGVMESNAFGTDEFVKLSRLVGWEPYICNNAGNGTIEEMRNWVEYCNGTSGRYAQMRKDNGHAKPLNVNIWSIGNENYGSWEIGHKPIEQWAPLVLEAAKAMKAADPKIKLSAAANEAYAPLLLKMAGSYLDYISIHGYWFGLHNKHEIPDYLSCIMRSERPEKRISGFIRVLDESGYRGRIKIAFDEWNLRGWHHPGFPRKKVQDYADPEVAKLVKAREKNDIASQYTMADALFSASFFNACLRHSEDVAMANIAPVVNTRGPLFVHPKGIVKRTHFHVMAMYANELKERVGSVKVTSSKLTHGKKTVAVVDAIATVDKSGKRWAISLVNRHPSDSVACTVKMKDTPVDGEYDATVLTGDSPDSYNDIEHPNRVVPKKIKLAFKKGVANLTPHSLTIVHLPAKSTEESVTIDAETVKKWSQPYRNWHYYPDHVIGAKPNIKGFEKVHMTDVPTVFQLPGDKKWYMTFIGFDGKGYQSFVAESDDLVNWTNMRLAMGYGPKDTFDYGGAVLGAYLYEDYDIKAPRTVKKKDGMYWSLYGAYPRQGGYELRPGYEGVASSDDGITWKRAKDEAILSVHQKDCGKWEKDCIYQPWLVEHAGKYYNFYNAANGHIEQMGLALSEDILNWKRYENNPIISIGPEGSYNEKFSSDGKVFRDADHWVCFFFGVGKGGAHIMAAFSRDLYHWTVDPEPLYKAGGNPSGLDKNYAHKISLVWNPANETYYMYYNAVGNKGRGIGLITSKPLAKAKHKPDACDGKQGLTSLLLNSAKMQKYVTQFNADDEELYANTPNREAFSFQEKNIPLFECPDPDFEQTYNFRWWTYRNHIKKTPDGYVITEFLPKVPWSGKYTMISCPAGHHYYEGRWLHNPEYLDDYSVFWLRKGGEPRRYSFWIADAFYARKLVIPNKELLVDLLPDLIKNYQAWETGWKWVKYFIGQLKKGLFYTIDDWDSGEMSIGGHGFRPILNSFMYGDANAIAAILLRPLH